MRQKIASDCGQALIIILVAAAVALSVLTFATLAAIGQTKNSGRTELGREVYYAAESGAEYALMKLMRAPGNCSGSDTLTVGSANVNIAYSPAGLDCAITSTATQTNIVKVINLKASYDSSQFFNYSGWLEK